MAASYDNSTSSSSSSYSHTVGGGTNRLLVVFTLTISNNDITAVTYNGSALTFYNEINDVSNGCRIEVWYLTNPASGANTVDITGFEGSNDGSYAVSYANVDQTTPIDNGTFTFVTGVTNYAVNVTSTKAGDIIAAAVYEDGISTLTATSPTVKRQGDITPGGETALFEKGPLATIGTITFNFTGTSSNRTDIAAIAIRDDTVAAGPTSVKTYNGIAKANIKTINGIPIANIKSWNGLT